MVVNFNVFLSSEFFFETNFSKNYFRITIRVSNSFDPIRPDILSGLIWTQTVCKDYRQTILVPGKDLNVHAPSGARSVRFDLQLPPLPYSTLRIYANSDGSDGTAKMPRII